MNARTLASSEGKTTYGYDHNGVKRSYKIVDGRTYKIDGTRMAVGSTVQTTDGIYKMTMLGGQRVTEHNQYLSNDSNYESKYTIPPKVVVEKDDGKASYDAWKKRQEDEADPNAWATNPIKEVAENIITDITSGNVTKESNDAKYKELTGEEKEEDNGLFGGININLPDLPDFPEIDIDWQKTGIIIGGFIMLLLIIKKIFD